MSCDFCLVFSMNRESKSPHIDKSFSINFNNINSSATATVAASAADRELEHFAL